MTVGLVYNQHDNYETMPHFIEARRFVYLLNASRARSLSFASNLNEAQRGLFS
ncbi:hypothetical protein CI610_02507 [invertebrate metagenome]|uniref:Uncharacterized protein n=1 Tax=invertebrate metagenome TaxID=1711999 RepID=A0A2H9T5Q6_9ZZZZ